MSKIIMNADLGKYKINKNIYGQFSEHIGRCIYEGIWVGEDSPIPNTCGIRNDVIEALKKIKVPVLRWPGGCFADDYHWMDGIGPCENRPSIININWGGVTENNHFGTHEFMDLCEMIGADPYICGNVGSGTVKEMRDWVEYITFEGKSPMADLRRKNGREEPWKLPYFGIGNENWGCGGTMRPEYYADEYKRYQTFVRNFSENYVNKIACGPLDDDYNWTEVLMKEVATPSGAGHIIHGLALHCYCWSGNKSKSATVYEEDDWFALLQRALKMDDIIRGHSTVMDRYDPEKKVGLMVDEWGTWHEVEPGTNPGFMYQQNTIRDALVAGLTLNIFNNHADRVRMANIAQLVNVLQAMILTEGKKMTVTPTYHVFEMYAVHQDATLLPIDIKNIDYEYGNERIPAVTASASRDDAGKMHITLTNQNPNDKIELSISIRGADVSSVSGRVLSADNITAHNTFENPDVVKPNNFDGAKIVNNEIKVTMPSKSIVTLELE